MAKPSAHLDWVTDDDAAKMTEPSTGKKLTGWTASERPAFQLFNWLFNNVDKWIKYFETVTDDLLSQYDIIVGSGAMATHATLAAAVADANYGPDKRVLVQESATIDATIQLTKNNWHIVFAPGVTFTRGAVATAIQVNASGVMIERARFASFSTVGDKAIEFQAAGDYGHVLYCRFASCDTEVDDSAVTAGKVPVVLGSITEA